MFRCSLLLLFLFVEFFSYSQKNRLPNYFGVQVRPILATNAGGQELNNLSIDNFNINISQNIGY